MTSPLSLSLSCPPLSTLSLLSFLGRRRISSKHSFPMALNIPLPGRRQEENTALLLAWRQWVGSGEADITYMLSIITHSVGESENWPGN